MSDSSVKDSACKSYPFIVWTLQRTGGTNLTEKLAERSSFEAIQHEPFGLARLYGHVTKQWLESQNRSALAHHMDEVVANRPIIKHCLERVPWDVSQALADASLRAGYCHLFVYRRNAFDRLLSLHFAQTTSVWGIKMKLAGALDEMPVPAVSVNRLVRHERKCVNLLHSMWQYLVSHGAYPQAVSYEQIYFAGAEAAADILLPILRMLGLSHGNANDVDFARTVIENGNQGTRGLYSAISGAKALEQALLSVPCFKPKADASVLRTTAVHLPSWILKAKICTTPRQLSDGLPFFLGGVIVLSADAPKDVSLHLMVDGAERGIAWGLPSPRMASLYPTSAQSAHARFRTTELRITAHQTFEVVLESNIGERYLVFKMSRS